MSAWPRSAERLRELYPNHRVEALGSYRAKADFGDCDLLVEGGSHYDPMMAAAVLGAVEVVRNGPVTSVGVVVRPKLADLDGNVFQVDLVKVEPEAFDFARQYFGHGDTGNLLGRLFHACGLTLRHDGLYYYVRDGDYKFRELVLTRDFSQALRFLDYDPEVLAKGFDSLEDVYRYVTSSPFFNPALFLLENRNAKSRIRDRKRAMYMQFLAYCRTHPELTAYPYPKDKSAWLSRVAQFFPGFRAEYDKALADLAELRAVKAKFNGQWVAQLTGLQGQELGALMRRLKASFATAEEMRSFVLSQDEAALADWVRRTLLEA